MNLFFKIFIFLVGIFSAETIYNNNPMDRPKREGKINLNPINPDDARKLLDIFTDINRNTDSLGGVNMKALSNNTDSNPNRPNPNGPNPNVPNPNRPNPNVPNPIVPNPNGPNVPNPNPNVPNPNPNMPNPNPNVPNPSSNMPNADPIVPNPNVIKTLKRLR